jgi:hypothetical protein
VTPSPDPTPNDFPDIAHDAQNADRGFTCLENNIQIETDYHACLAECGRKLLNDFATLPYRQTKGSRNIYSGCITTCCDNYDANMTNHTEQCGGDYNYDYDDPYYY